MQTIFIKKGWIPHFATIISLADINISLPTVSNDFRTEHPSRE